MPDLPANNETNVPPGGSGGPGGSEHIEADASPPLKLESQKAGKKGKAKKPPHPDRPRVLEALEKHLGWKLEGLDGDVVERENTAIKNALDKLGTERVLGLIAAAATHPKWRDDPSLRAPSKVFATGWRQTLDEHAKRAAPKAPAASLYGARP